MDNEYMSEYMRSRYSIIRHEMIRLLGNKCIQCGTDEFLQFDHINREEKEYSISKIMLGNRRRLLKEIKKCQLLCDDCHRKKHTSPHGTLASARHCKCDLCKKVKSDYNKEYNKKRANSLTGQANSS